MGKEKKQTRCGRRGISNANACKSTLYYSGCLPLSLFAQSNLIEPIVLHKAASLVLLYIGCTFVLNLKRWHIPIIISISSISITAAESGGECRMSRAIGANRAYHRTRDLFMKIVSKFLIKRETRVNASLLLA